jgi:hypothetical protein
LRDEEEQEEFNRKADAAAPHAGCCLLELFIAASALAGLLALPAGLQLGSRIA